MALLRGRRGQGLSQAAINTFPEQVGKPLAITLKGDGGALQWFLAKAMGKAAGAWGQGDGCPRTSYLLPHPWTGARRAAIVLLLAQSCVPFRHYFWPREEEEKKAKKGVAVLSGTFARKGF